MPCPQPQTLATGHAANRILPIRPVVRRVAAVLWALVIILAVGLLAVAPVRAQSVPAQSVPAQSVPAQSVAVQSVAVQTDPAAVADILAEAMQLGALFEVMAAEGRTYGDKLEAEMFPGAGGAAWRAEVAAIYAPDRQLALFRETFDAALATGGADGTPMMAFFASDLGRRIVTLELSARRALLDEAVDEASRLRYQEALAAADPRLAAVAEFVTVNDLVEANVAGALNANYAFYRGLLDTGGLAPTGPTEDEVIADVWSQEEAIREETDQWIHAYLFMAYAPLSDQELASYLAFSRSGPGQALNHALFAGFDRVFADVSRQLGQAVGRRLNGSDL